MGLAKTGPIPGLTRVPKTPAAYLSIYPYPRATGHTASTLSPRVAIRRS